MLKTVVIGVALLVVAAVVSSVWLSRPVVVGALDEEAFGELSIAPTGQAVTLAVSEAGAVLLVTAADADGIAAIDIASVTGHAYRDAIDAYQSLGLDQLRDLFGQASSSSYPWSRLVLPVSSIFRNIAAGTNYRAHAEEVGHEGEPFLFPKLSGPTSWNSAVASGVRLDYEVELCAVTLAEHRRESPAALGYLLCGDFTDRWLLVRDIDLDGDMGRTGFPLAKGGKSRLPVGPLLVIPDEDDFYRELTLSLYVNDRLRQYSGADKMIWPPRKILSRGLADCRTPYELQSETVFIADCDEIVAGTLLLTGTPAGVLFQLATLWNPWAYLRPGDVVTSFGTYLGYTRNKIL